MANVDPADSELKPLNEHDAARIYEENAAPAYGLLRLFLSEPQAIAALEALAAELTHALPGSGYRRYARLLCLRLAHTHLRDDLKAKVPKELLPRHAAEKHLEPGFDEYFSLLLRDRLELSSFEIAAVVGSSEGSIRTRLERTRAKLFAAIGDSQAGRGTPVAGHVCIKSREAIEDWNVLNARLGQFTVPPNVAKATGDCPRCEAALRQRLESLAFFRELPRHEVPEKAKAYPVTPLFVREGRRMLFNWAAAPWYVKALFEGLLATTLVLGIILSIPRIKTLYEFWLERRLDLYSIAEMAANISGRSESTNDQTSSKATPSISTAASNAHGPNGPGPTTGATAPDSPKTAANSRGEPLSVKPETEFLGRESEIPSSEKIYRVFIKTDAPESLKEQVFHVLGAVHYAAADDDMAVGAELPGGVMFDVFVPLKSYKQLVNELAKLGETKFIITRAKEPGQAGKAHLKIWLQRI